jgi:hypothetical protein
MDLKNGNMLLLMKETFQDYSMTISCSINEEYNQEIYALYDL